jgi:hypothetical protein
MGIVSPKKKAEHLDSKGIPLVRAYISKWMIDTLIRRPAPEEQESVRAVVQTTVDEIYGGPHVGSADSCVTKKNGLGNPSS